MWKLLPIFSCPFIPPHILLPIFSSSYLFSSPFILPNYPPIPSSRKLPSDKSVEAHLEEIV